MLKALSNLFVSLFYPQTCRICGLNVESISDGTACRTCWNKTRIFSDNHLLCFKCGDFLHETEKQIEVYCHLCDDHQYDTARAVGIYEFGLAASVVNLKKIPVTTKSIREHFIATFNGASFTDTTLIIPVPLSKKRLIERGFNQAEILAKILAKAVALPYDTGSLARSVHTPMHRAAMDRKARELTVKNAFQVTRPKLIENQNILLIDDVFTSGSTVSYCAKALKKSGAVKVNVLTLARAVQRNR